MTCPVHSELTLRAGGSQLQFLQMLEGNKNPKVADSVQSEIVGHPSWVIKAQLEEGTVLTADEVARPKYNRRCAVDLVAGKLGSAGTTKSETVGPFFRAVSTMRGS